MRSEHLGNLRDTPDIFGSIIITEPQIRVEAVAEIIAIENDHKPALVVKFPLQSGRNRRFARTTEPIHPEHSTLLAKKLLLFAL